LHDADLPVPQGRAQFLFGEGMMNLLKAVLFLAALPFILLVALAGALAQAVLWKMGRL
jgi:hypothetical protein